MSNHPIDNLCFVRFDTIEGREIYLNASLISSIQPSNENLQTVVCDGLFTRVICSKEELFHKLGLSDEAEIKCSK